MSTANALPIGTAVGLFEIRQVLGQGGFGIVYVAFDPGLQRQVAIKEYFPQQFARRDGLAVVPSHPGAAEMFESGLRRFVREARLLSLINERASAQVSLVTVHAVFQENGTAYMVMKLYDGVPLNQHLQQSQSTVTESWLIGVLLRLLDALEALHSLPGEHLVHRDVAPDNIIIQPDGTPVLLDFGAARRVSDEKTRTIVKPGYSPIEQYTDALDSGPWTDLYALCGVAYYAVCGRAPTPALDRYAGKALVPATQVGAGRYSEHLLVLIDRGLALLPERRFQSATEMREGLLGGASTEQANVHPGTPGVLSPGTPGPAPDAGATIAPAAVDDDVTRVLPSAFRRQASTEDRLRTGVGAGESSAPTSTTLERTAASASATPSARPGGQMPDASASTRAPNRIMLSLGLVVLAAFAVTVFTVTRSPNAFDFGAATPAKVPDEGRERGNLVPGLACGAEFADWECVVRGLARLGGRPDGVVLRITPDRQKLGGKMSLTLESPTDGRIRIFSVNDAPDARLEAFFPNAHDGDDRIRAGAPLRLPRLDRWDIVAQPPLGRGWMIAVMVPDQPGGDVATASNVRSISLREIVQAFRDGSPRSVLGLRDCASTAGDCADGVAVHAAAFSIE